MKDGEKIVIEDNDVFYTWRDGVYIQFLKKNGKFETSPHRIDIEKIEKLETVNGVTYVRLQRNEKAPFGFYKTLINGKDKKLICCFRPYGSQRDRLQISYTILDANGKEIESAYYREDEPEKQEAMFQAIEKHFPTCTEVLENMATYKGKRPWSNFYTGKPPEGFTYQNKVFDCN